MKFINFGGFIRFIEGNLFLRGEIIGSRVRHGFQLENPNEIQIFKHRKFSRAESAELLSFRQGVLHFGPQIFNPMKISRIEFVNLESAGFITTFEKTH